MGYKMKTIDSIIRFIIWLISILIFLYIGEIGIDKLAILIKYFKTNTNIFFNIALLIAVIISVISIIVVCYCEHNLKKLQKKGA